MNMNWKSKEINSEPVIMIELSIFVARKSALPEGKLCSTLFHDEAPSTKISVDEIYFHGSSPPTTK